MLIEKLQTIEDKYNELTAFLSDPEVFSDFSKYQKYSKEQASIADIVKKFREYKKILADIKEAGEILSTGNLLLPFLDPNFTLLNSFFCFSVRASTFVKQTSIGLFSSFSS